MGISDSYSSFEIRSQFLVYLTSSGDIGTSLSVDISRELPETQLSEKSLTTTLVALEASNSLNLGISSQDSQSEIEETSQSFSDFQSNLTSYTNSLTNSNSQSKT